jgi:hypothetical protein
LLPLTDQAGSGMLTRVNRQSIEGHVTTDSVVFQRHASVPAGFRSTLVSGINGSARLTTEFADGFVVHEIGASGAVILIGNQQFSDLGSNWSASAGQRSRSDEQFSTSNDRITRSDKPPSNTEPSLRHSRDLCSNLHGLVALHRVPGFSNAPVAIAEIGDGSRLVLDLREGGARVAGTFTGPIGPMDVTENWGLIAGRDQATIYRVRRG